MLDDGVIGRPSIDKRDGIQRDADANEVEDFIDESAASRKRIHSLSTQPISNTHGKPCSIPIKKTSLHRKEEMK